MLNLLFISDSPKVEYLKSVLQPLLKVIIDVVPDFDHGLKDVFEKRPTTVCVQDQIGGVTGESVARHIQMLLGNSAPTFILLHSGSGKARAIKGLYEHLVDLNQSNEALAENIKSTLMSLLGDQWDKIYIPPKLTPASVRSSLAVPEESRAEADMLVDDFISDLETSGFATVDDPPPAASSSIAVLKESTPVLFAPPPHTDIHFGADESDHIQTTSDELAELLLAEVNKAARKEHTDTASSLSNSRQEPFFNGMPKSAPAPQVSSPPPPIVSPSPASWETPAAGTQPKVAPVSRPAITAMQTAPAPTHVKQTPRAVAAPSGAAASAKPATPVRPSSISHTSKPGVPATPPAAEFRIRQNSSSSDDPLPGELLQAFEENYRSTSRNGRNVVIIALVCTLSAAGVWYFVTQKPLLANSLKQRLFSTSAVTKLPTAVPAATPVTNPASVSLPQSTTAPPLPAFIPKNGHDTAYAEKNPGWERYVGPLTEFRLFSAAGRVMAVQVLSVKEVPVPESLISTVLLKYAGSADYRITSRNTRAGVLVESGGILNKGEVQFYRKNGAVMAFVVSVN